MPSAHPKIWAARCSGAAWDDFAALLASLYAAADDGDAVQTKHLLRQLVPEYQGRALRGDPGQRVGAPYPDGF